jgi:hypothetical protein
LYNLHIALCCLLFVKRFVDILNAAVVRVQLLYVLSTTHGKFTRKRQSEKITKRVWFYQGWALLMGAGLERNIQRGCQRPFGTGSEIKELEDQEIKNQSSFSCWAAVILIHRALIG